MRRSMKLAAVPIGLLFLTGPTRADRIPIFNTGVDASGTRCRAARRTRTGQSSPAPASRARPLARRRRPSPFYAVPADSRWIWVNAGGSGSTGSPYTFRLTFDLTGLDASTATISGAWGSTTRA